MFLNGNLCDTFDHMKWVKELKDIDEVENMGWIRSIIRSPFKELPHIICGDKCGYLWIIDIDTLNILNIFDTHTD